MKETESVVHTLGCKNAEKKKMKNNSFENRVSQHLLFNALNAVVSLCHKNPEAAAELVGAISIYLQRSLEDKASLITLDEELEHVFAYMNIQKTRFPDRLKIVVEIEDSIQCRIPPFTVQPLVDNAIRHGILKKRQGGTVIVSIRKRPCSVRITVQDDGAGMSEEQLNLLFKRRNKDHSIYKVNQALKKAGSKGLEIKSLYNGGTVVMMEIPP